MPQIAGSIPRRKLGRHDVEISALGFGGHHLGEAPDQKTAERMLQAAVDGGITFFDNCWEYRRGKTELWMGEGLKGRRDQVFLMTKTCPHGAGCGSSAADAGRVAGATADRSFRTFGRCMGWDLKTIPTCLFVRTERPKP